MSEKFVEFNIGKEKFGININKIKYIEEYQEIIHVPNTPKYIEGILNIHGEIVAIYNLHKKFGLNYTNPTEDTIFMMVSFGDISIGMIADDVSEIIEADDSNIESTPPIILENSQYISYVLKLEDRIVMVLDIDKIISQKEKEKITDLIQSQ